MERQPGEPELMGAFEAAQTLGVAQSNLRTTSGLPEPYMKLKSTTLWRADEIRSLAWRRLRKRVTGLHPTTEKEAAAA